MLAADLSLLAFSIAVASVATLAILPFGVAAAWWLAHRRFRGKAVIETLFSLPLVLPPTAVGVALLELLRPSGPIGAPLRAAGVEILFTPAAVVIAAGVMSFPLLVRTARTAFEEVSPRLIDVARTLGRGRAYVFARVVLPLAWRGIVTGALLAFARALGEFGATILIAGNIPGRTQTASLAIFHRTQLGQDAAALRLGLLVALVAFGVILTTELVSARRGKKLAG